MSSSLSNLADNLSEALPIDECIDCKSCLDYMSVKDDQQSCTQMILSLLSVKRIIRKNLIKN